MPSGDRTSAVPSRYQPLCDLLAGTDGDEVALTYKEVAALVGGPLPASAVLHAWWWRSKKNRHVQAWRAMGWRAHASAATRRVRFVRDLEEYER